MSYPPPAILDTELKQEQAPDTLQGYLIENKYFVRNTFVINILQTLTPCNPLKASILRPKYPQGGRGGTPQQEERRSPRGRKHSRKSSEPGRKRHAGTTPEGP
jgi:hypothetical protein